MLYLFYITKAIFPLMRVRFWVRPILVRPHLDQLVTNEETEMKNLAS